MPLTSTLLLLLALAPALVAIVLALTTRRVGLSLFLGVATGAVVAHLDQVLAGQVIDALEALFGFLADAVLPGLSAFELEIDSSGNLLFGTFTGDLSTLDTSHLLITAFSLFVAGMVGVLGRSGGTRALVRLVEGVARGPRGAQVAAWLAGGIVFFDDYANCLVVGSAMGPLFDRFRVSRAKLAYIVDSTAAPIASIAVVSTWVGYEVGLIGDELTKLNHPTSGFTLFLQALPYSFYGIITLAMVGAIAISGRDFGPMHAAEVAARRRPRPAETTDAGRSGKAWAAIAPVAGLVLMTFIWLVADGMSSLRTAAAEAHPGDATAAAAQVANAAWFDVIGAADPFAALLWSSLAALILAVVLAAIGRQLPLTRAPSAVWAGMRPVFSALVVLFFAWALGNAMGDTHAAQRLKDVIAPADTFTFQGEPITMRGHAASAGQGADLRILDAGYSEVYREERAVLEAGDGQLTWDGRSTAGTGATAGTYRLLVDARTEDGAAVDVMVRGHQRFPPWLLPAVVFLVASGTAFATGTSFGTMGILIPLVIPLGVGLEAGGPGPILLASTAAVLAGAILGDHASPISDTTVLSALGAGVDLMAHVKTQLPYALVAGVIALVLGYIPAGLGVSPWLLLPLGCGAAAAVVWIVGRPTAPRHGKLDPGDEALVRPEKPGGMGYERG